MYEKSLHVQKSYKKAVECYKKAAKNKNSKAYYHLAQLAEIKILDEKDNYDTYVDVSLRNQQIQGIVMHLQELGSFLNKVY